MTTQGNSSNFTIYIFIYNKPDYSIDNLNVRLQQTETETYKTHHRRMIFMGTEISACDTTREP